MLSLHLCFKSFFAIHWQVLDAAVRAILEGSAILPSPVAQGLHPSGSTTEQSQGLLQKVICTSWEPKCFSVPLDSSRYPLFPISWVHKARQRYLGTFYTHTGWRLYSGVHTGKHLLLEQACKQRDNQPAGPSSCAHPGSKAQTKTHC